MSTATADALIHDYLERLRTAAAALPPERREELLQEIAEHIEAARSAGQADDEASVRTLLDRLGEPAEIVAAAEPEGAEPPPPGPAWSTPSGYRGPVAPYPYPPKKPGMALEIAAVILLTVGSFVPVVGWLVGVVLLWASSRWRLWEKLLGTLIVPFGPGILLPLSMLTVGPTSSCNVTSNGESSCTTTGPPEWALLVAVVFIAVAPFIVAFWLLRVARRRADQEAAGSNGGAASPPARPPVPGGYAAPSGPTYHTRSAWGGLELAGFLTVALGGLVLPVIGTLIGIGLVWLSHRWDHRTKVNTSVAVGISLAVGLVTGLGLAAGGEASIGFPQAVLTGRTVDIGAMALPTLLFDVVPLAVALTLARRLHRPTAEIPA